MQAQQAFVLLKTMKMWEKTWGSDKYTKTLKKLEEKHPKINRFLASTVGTVEIQRDGKCATVFFSKF